MAGYKLPGGGKKFGRGEGLHMPDGLVVQCVCVCISYAEGCLSSPNG